MLWKVHCIHTEGRASVTDHHSPMHLGRAHFNALSEMSIHFNIWISLKPRNQLYLLDVLDINALNIIRILCMVAKL